MPAPAPRLWPRSPPATTPAAGGHERPAARARPPGPMAGCSSPAEIIVLELAAAVRLEGSTDPLAPARSPILDTLRDELLAELARRGLKPLPAPEGGLAWEDAS